MSSKPRITLREAEARSKTTQEVAAASGVDAGVVLQQAAALNDRLKATLNLDSDPIGISATGTWRVDGVAGLLRLNSAVELEVVPKFLTDHDSWREDFFVLAVLVRTGRLLVGDRISAGISTRADLATLIARALLAMHWENHRRSIRGYLRTRTYDFSFDGEVDLDSLALPDADGFLIERLELTGANPHNAVLKGALAALVPEVSDGDTRAQLVRRIRQFGPQGPPPAVPPPLPMRHKRWQPAFDLSRLVLDGLGLDLAGGSFTGPGFVVSTWSAWQSLCEELVRRATPGLKSIRQHPYVLGHRRGGALVVRPDVALLEAAHTRLLLDAKYKTRQGRRPAVASTDVYESLAFMRAADVDQLLLLYPAVVAAAGTGECDEFEAVTVGDEVIRGLLLDVRGLSARSGFSKMVAGVRGQILAALESKSAA